MMSLLKRQEETELMAREFEDYLKDISDAMEKAQMFVAKMNYEEFIKDDKSAFAVIRAL